MNIDEPREEHIIEEDVHSEFGESFFHNLVADYILDSDIDQNNPNMVDSRQVAEQQGPQRMVVVCPMRNLPKFFCEKTESAGTHLDPFNDYLEIQQVDVVDTNVAQITT